MSTRPRETPSGDGAAMGAGLPWRATFPPKLHSARRVRAGVGAALETAGIPRAVLDDVVAVVSEMAANAALHARTEFTVTAAVENGVLRVEVFDRDTRPPALLGFDADSTGGRGMHVVAGIARGWGWRTAEDDGGVAGKVIWAEFPLEVRGDRAGPGPRGR